MFTGIIQDIGTITAIDKQGDWTLTIATEKLALDKTALGASISCSGICLTVIDLESRSGDMRSNRDQFKVQISMETLSKTTAIHWRLGQRINLETALKMGDELGGHILSGHVDGVARVVGKEPERDSLRYVFEVPSQFAKFLAPKGSAAIDGVSLTVNEVNGAKFSVNIIPHTQNMTTLAALEIGDEVNFEVDMIARYVERMLDKDTPQ